MENSGLEIDIYKQLLAFLKELGTDKRPHGNSTLLQHLVGTWKLLKQWGHPEYLCRAGLFHSIYGTETYMLASESLANRDRVRGLIGRRSEQLAYLFGAADRGTFFSPVNDQGLTVVRDLRKQRTVTVDQTTRVDLIEMEVANCIEQLPGLPESTGREYRSFLLGFEDEMSEAARRALRSSLRRPDTPAAES